MKTALILSALILAAGCSGRLVLMQNDKGDVQRCEVSAGSEMMGGAILSKMSINRCVEQWEQLGYKKVGDK